MGGVKGVEGWKSGGMEGWGVVVVSLDTDISVLIHEHPTHMYALVPGLSIRLHPVLSLSCYICMSASIDWWID